jgi:hypothetical protein
LGAFSTVTAHPGLHSRYKTCTGTAITRPAGFTGFAAGRVALAAGFRVRATRRAAGREPFVRDALIILFSTSPQIPAAPG